MFNLRHELKQFQFTLLQNPEEKYLRILTHVLWTNEIFEPIRKRALGFIRARHYSALLDLADSLSGQTYPDAAQHFAANQFASLIRKYPFDPKTIPGIDPEGSAWLKFDKAEKRCRRYNRYFRAQRVLGERFPAEKHKMRGWIRHALGDSPNLVSIYRKCGFGPGASIGVHGNATNFARKLFAENWSVSAGALPYVCASFAHHAQMKEFLASRDEGTYPLPECDLDFGANRVRDLIFEKGCTYVGHNNITFVPKTTKVLRSIAVEPVLNSWIQKGIDEEIRHRLLRVGLDLSDQSMNQIMAQSGSAEWETDDPYCTIDLSSASDSISTEVVRDLLPPDWFDLLNSTRSRSFKYKDKVSRYEKFVSMGNGFCFPLQTLIFASICVAASNSVSAAIDFRVYGDDIIVRRAVFPKVLELLKHFGFTPNPDKTFSEGPFRESCGKDFFAGEDVRPIILDYKLDSIESIFKFHNAIQSSKRASWLLAGIPEYLRSIVPPSLRFVRPILGQADAGFDVALDTFMASKFSKWNPRLQAWSWTELQHISVLDKVPYGHSKIHLAMLIAALSGSASTKPFTVRRLTRTRIRVTSYAGQPLPSGGPPNCFDGQLVSGPMIA